ncbi:hypothetical protein [Rhizobium tubonense]|uniref:Uncharacterized protein n=1 Tax=Rhizobium tubonense TaxID=484088 RepID=A0A2W4C615_9HYPH|nr:hypothetical protein [Rhizobium tubonense]PZM08937.1 hypothetical protein CPY51_27410 [Rhizobium tubonense]
MSRAAAAISIIAIFGIFHAPVDAAEFRKTPGQSESSRSQLRKTPDIGSANGEINTDPAMTYSTNRTKPGNAAGTDCRNGNGQTYPNANTDNPPGFQPCPE